MRLFTIDEMQEMHEKANEGADSPKYIITPEGVYTEKRFFSWEELDKISGSR